MIFNFSFIQISFSTAVESQLHFLHALPWVIYPNKADI